MQKLAKTLAWIISVAAAVIGLFGLYSTNGSPWLTYGYLAAAAAIAFAVLANPLTSRLLGLRGKWRLTAVMQFIVIGVGVAGLSLTLHQARLHGLGFASESEYTAAKNYDLALDYQTGSNGKSVDYREAASLYEAACKESIAPACFNLATLYEIGGPFAFDPIRSGALYEEACALQFPDACYNRAFQFALGEGMAPSQSRAAHFYQTGCDQGHGSSCLNLGVLYQKGSGDVEQDTAMADGLFQRACELGETKACDVQ